MSKLQGKGHLFLNFPKLDSRFNAILRSSQDNPWNARRQICVVDRPWNLEEVSEFSIKTWCFAVYIHGYPLFVQSITFLRAHCSWNCLKFRLAHCVASIEEAWTIAFLKAHCNWNCFKFKLVHRVASLEEAWTITFWKVHCSWDCLKFRLVHCVASVEEATCFLWRLNREVESVRKPCAKRMADIYSPATFTSR